MKYHKLYYRNEAYYQGADSLKEARQKFADEHVCSMVEVQSAFRHKFPVIFLKWGIGLISLGFIFWMIYLIT